MQLYLIWSFITSLTLLQKVLHVRSQTFIRSCNDQVILDHQARNGHSFCSHACGNLPQSATAVCLPNGSCACPCSAGAPQLPFGDICPPRGSDPGDPDPTALPRCQAACAGTCAGGVGMICGETSAQGPNMDMFAKICTCNCPPPCTPPTTTTTTTPATVSTTTQKSIILVKSPFWLLKKVQLLALWTIIKKAFVISLTVLGLLAKLVLFKIIVILFMDMIVSVINEVVRSLDSFFATGVRMVFGNLFKRLRWLRHFL